MLQNVRIVSLLGLLCLVTANDYDYHWLPHNTHAVSASQATGPPATVPPAAASPPPGPPTNTGAPPIKEPEDYVVKPGEFPFMVSFRGDYGHFCGGILLTPTHVLTAARCFTQFATKWNNQLTATTGIIYQPEVSSANTVGIQRVIYHAEFNEYDNNIAIVKLANATTGTLPGAPRSLGAGGQTAVGQKLTAVGWGVTGPQDYPMPTVPYQLYKTQLRLAKPEECSSAEGFGRGTGKLCAVSHNLTVCKNDVGGPLVDASQPKPKLIGIVSHAIRGCPVPGPVVLTDIRHFADWINGAVEAANTPQNRLHKENVWATVGHRRRCARTWSTSSQRRVINVFIVLRSSSVILCDHCFFYWSHDLCMYSGGHLIFTQKRSLRSDSVKRSHRQTNIRPRMRLILMLVVCGCCMLITAGRKIKIREDYPDSGEAPVGSRRAASFAADDDDGDTVTSPPDYADETTRGSMSARIINGRVARADEFNFVVSIRHNGRHVCGGSVLQDLKSVITAAHCIFDIHDYPVPVEDLTVAVGIRRRTGVPRSNTIAVRQAVAHPNYDKQRIRNDIAILRLAKSAAGKGNVSSVELPPANREPDVGTELHTVGWGLTEEGPYASPSEQLLKTTLKLLDRATCQRKLKTGPIPQSQICTENETSGTCEGDSGGPLVNRRSGVDYLVGLTSYGVKGCNLGTADVFTKVSHYTDWIQGVANGKEPAGSKTTPAPRRTTTREYPSWGVAEDDNPTPAPWRPPPPKYPSWDFDDDDDDDMFEGFFPDGCAGGGCGGSRGFRRTARK
ncbi:uncharacterized protein LOC129592999 [Paramacrobiotus metropolitanus]|uniref:uncharacterized protein LOC129592999 n=1 Tax=Paramacrobiotus metropolitanus TaxID=2943436 RepID=UPI0024463809|nr:uncharacterized protein LOC129592999 [Paramacrobiotus metropolitanus]